jgi:uncharacterized protein YjiS (DUF1127 family)
VPPKVIIAPCFSGEGQAMLIVVFLFETIGRYLRYRRQLASIDVLDDRTLRDIGLERSKLRAAAWDITLHGAAHQ